MMAEFTNLQASVPVELSDRVAAAARRAGKTRSGWLRWLVESHLDGQLAGRPEKRQATVDEHAKKLEGARGLIDQPLPPVPPRPTGAPAGWQTTQEPVSATGDGEPTYQAPHVPKGDGYCRAGCDIDVDVSCRWPVDHPDRPENRRRRR